ncbi:hypothetical protein Taro_050157 [Colocasia esculenta]|uniref:Uncharacterized protein n=1 Tax=Colocasia esculenta TaxID=4460 RepID=A0A843XCR3_COLES|nr:hypothetical protein [Colocasia esculenta]
MYNGDLQIKPSPPLHRLPPPLGPPCRPPPPDPRPRKTKKARPVTGGRSGHLISGRRRRRHSTATIVAIIYLEFELCSLVKMLSGIKFIPRNQAQEISDSGSSPRERKESKGKKKRDDKKRRKKAHDDSSEDDDNTEKSKGRNRSRGRTKKKASYSSDDDDVSSRSMSRSYSDSEEEKPRRKKRSKKKRNNGSSDEDVSSDDDEHHHRRRRKDGHEDVCHSNKELMRKEMGLDWMFKPKDAIERGVVEANDANEEPATEEVVGERWGSLGQLAASVASNRAAHTRAHLHAIKDRKRGITENSEAIEHHQEKEATGEAYIGRRDYLQDNMVATASPE